MSRHFTRGFVLLVTSLATALLGCGFCFAQDSLNVRKVGFYNPPGLALGVAVAGNYAYVADHLSGLRVVSVMNPANPVQMGFYDTPGLAYSVAVAGNYAYVADYDRGLRVVNIMNPAAPFEAGFYDTPGEARGVAVAGNYAYVADRDCGLRVVDITNPAAPFEAGFYDTPADAYIAAVAGNYAYVADGGDGLRVIDITNPAAPFETGFYDTPRLALGVAVAGRYACVADGDSGLRVVDITNPATPFEAGFCNTPGYALGVAVAGSYAYVADGGDGLRVVNIANPAAPFEAGFYDTPGDAWDVAVAGNYAYVADYYELGIYDCSLATQRGLFLSSPNGGEQWRVFQNDTVRWESYGLAGSIRIELNRNYPSGTWEVLADSTVNDGEEAFFITDPLSTHCRVRVSTVGDTLSDISDGDFSIVSSQGYLALVRPAQPGTPVISWNAGTLECPQAASETFRLKNFGSEAIVVFQPLEPPTTEFSRATSCGSFFALAPGQMSACSLRLSFAPQNDGTHRDTLLIQTDAINGIGGYVRIPLSGTQISTPATPNVVIVTSGPDAVLHWNPVTQSVGGCPITVTGYLVFFSEEFAGPYWYHGFTSDTAYVHTRAVQYASGMFYHVVASTDPLTVLRSLPEGGVVSEADVRRMLARE